MNAAASQNTPPNQTGRYRRPAVLLAIGAVLVLTALLRDFRLSRYWPRTTLSVGREILIVDDTRSPDLASAIRDFVEARFDYPVRIVPSPFCLDFSYDRRRRQYNYNDILNTLEHRISGNEGKVLLLTDKDTFGQTFRWSAGTAVIDGNLLLVSSCRLDPGFWTGHSDAALCRTRTEKIVMHELGHSFGIEHEHAFDAGCIMYDTNSADDIDKVTPVFTRLCLEHMRPFLRPPFEQAVATNANTTAGGP